MSHSPKSDTPQFDPAAEKALDEITRKFFSPTEESTAKPIELFAEAIQVLASKDVSVEKLRTIQTASITYLLCSSADTDEARALASDLVSLVDLKNYAGEEVELIDRIEDSNYRTNELNEEALLSFLALTATADPNANVRETAADIFVTVLSLVHKNDPSISTRALDLIDQVTVALTKGKYASKGSADAAMEIAQIGIADGLDSLIDNLLAMPSREQPKAEITDQDRKAFNLNFDASVKALKESNFAEIQANAAEQIAEITSNDASGTVISNEKRVEAARALVNVLQTRFGFGTQISRADIEQDKSKLQEALTTDPSSLRANFNWESNGEKIHLFTAVIYGLEELQATIDLLTPSLASAFNDGVDSDIKREALKSLGAMIEDRAEGFTPGVIEKVTAEALANYVEDSINSNGPENPRIHMISSSAFRMMPALHPDKAARDKTQISFIRTALATTQALPREMDKQRVYLSNPNHPVHESEHKNEIIQGCTEFIQTLINECSDKPSTTTVYALEKYLKAFEALFPSNQQKEKTVAELVNLVSQRLHPESTNIVNAINQDGSEIPTKDVDRDLPRVSGFIIKSIYNLDPNNTHLKALVKAHMDLPGRADVFTGVRAIAKQLGVA